MARPVRLGAVDPRRDLSLFAACRRIHARYASGDAISLLFFAGFSALNIAILVIFDRTITRLIAQEHNVRTLVESAPNGIVIVADDGRILGVNRSTERLFGYERAELIGRQVEVLVPTTAGEKHRAVRMAYQARPEPRAMGAGRDLSGKRKDGTEFPVEIGLNPVDRAGHPPCWRR